MVILFVAQNRLQRYKKRMTYTRVYAIFCDFFRIAAGLEAVLLVVGCAFNHPIPGLEGLLAARLILLRTSSDALVYLRK